MNFPIYFIFTLLLINSSQGQERCLQKKECASKCAKNVIKVLLDGNTGLFRSVNTLTIKDFKYEIPGFEYKVTDGTLSPLKNCDADIAFVEDLYNYTLTCSQLVLKLHVCAKGRLGNLYIDGSDTITIIADNSILTASGIVGTFVDKKNHKVHQFLTKCYKVNNEIRGKITFKIDNNFGMSGIQAFFASRYCDANWKRLEEIIRYPVMNEFMSHFIQNKLGAYVRATPLEKLCGDVD